MFPHPMPTVNARSPCHSQPVTAQASSNTLDLRFVPDGTPFPNAPRDSASEVPTDYEPPHFYTAAMQSTNVELTCE